MTNLSEVDDYLKGHFAEVEGWCQAELWNLIQPIHEIQNSFGARGPAAEIGVFHGKFFIPLALTKKDQGQSLALDVFDMQQFNLDGAGTGNLDAFKRNLTNANLGLDQVAFLRGDSMALTRRELDEINDAYGQFLLFSVDGCHLAEHTVNDFQIAMELTAQEGVIFIDDYYNPDWPGVHEGISRLYNNSFPRFVPFIYSLNKLFCCHIGYHAILVKLVSDYLKAHYSDSRIKMVKRYGYDCINYFPAGGQYIVR